MELGVAQVRDYPAKAGYIGDATLMRLLAFK